MSAIRMQYGSSNYISIDFDLQYVPQTDCVAFAASLDQMFHFADVTSNSISTQILWWNTGVKSFNSTNSNRENEKVKQKGARGNNWNDQEMKIKSFNRT